MKSSYLVNLPKKYVQSYDGNVYKVMQNHFLQMSPWKDGEDRRVYEISDENVTMLTFENACMIVNNQFANTDEEWVHHGKKYIARAIADKSINEHAGLLALLPNHNILNKTKQYLSNMPLDQTISIELEDGMSELKMVKHKGKIYYILIVNEFLPRVKMYDTFGKFCQWANIKHCKPIFNMTDNKYV